MSVDFAVIESQLRQLFKLAIRPTKPSDWPDPAMREPQRIVSFGDMSLVFRGEAVRLLSEIPWLVARHSLEGRASSEACR